jgi:hypothetical protein
MSLGNPQSFNRYSYVENQATNFVDPSGLLMAVTRCEPDRYDEKTGTLYIGRCYTEIIGGGGSPGTIITSREPGGVSTSGGGGSNAGTQRDPCDNARLVALARDVNVTYGANAKRLFAPDFAAAFSAALREINSKGITPQINSGFRDNADQQRMRDGASGKNPAAAGISLHQTGNAVDIDGTWTNDFKIIRQIMSNYGFTWGGTWKKPNTDLPHFEINPFQKGTTGYDKRKQDAAAAANDYYQNRDSTCFSS